MFGPWHPHVQFQECLEKQRRELLPHRESQIMFHANALEKVYILDLCPIKELIISRCSFTGRPALNKPGIIRALVLASHYKESISSFVARLKADDILAIACGFDTGNIPGMGSFYDLSNQLWLENAPAKVV